MSLLPELNIDDAFLDRPSFQKTLEIWANMTNCLGDNVSSLAGAVKCVRTSSAEQKERMIDFAKSLEDASENFVLEGEDIPEPLLEFSKTIRELEEVRGTLITQTDRLTSGSVDDIATQFTQTKGLKAMLQETNAKHLSSLSKFAQIKLENGTVAEDYQRRAQKTFSGRQKAQKQAAAYAERVRHFVLVDKIAFMQKILEFMKTMQEFYQDGAKIMSSLDPYMMQLTDSLSLYKRAAEESHENDRACRERLAESLSSLYDEELAVLNATEFNDKSSVTSKMAKSAWKSVNKLKNTGTRSRSPKLRKKKEFRDRASISGSPMRNSVNLTSTTGRALSPVSNSDDIAAQRSSANLEALMPKNKEGYMFRRVKKQWRLEYFAIENNHLVTLDEDDKTTQLANLLLSTLRPCSNAERLHCFEVITPSDTLMLQPLGPRDHEHWTLAIHAGIADALETGNADGGDANVRLDPVKALSPIPGNQVCADCAAPDTEWASINLGILLCIGCSGAHRSLGVHISKVRSVTLDRWTPERLDFMKRVGNQRSNNVFEANRGDVPRLSPTATKAERQDFISRKYELKEFADPATVAEWPPKTGLDMIALEENALSVMEEQDAAPLEGAAGDEETDPLDSETEGLSVTSARLTRSTCTRRRKKRNSKTSDASNSAMSQEPAEILLAAHEEEGLTDMVEVDGDEDDGDTEADTRPGSIDAGAVLATGATAGEADATEAEGGRRESRRSHEDILGIFNHLKDQGKYYNQSTLSPVATNALMAELRATQGHYSESATAAARRASQQSATQQSDFARLGSELEGSQMSRNSSYVTTEEEPFSRASSMGFGVGDPATGQVQVASSRLSASKLNPSPLEPGLAKFLLQRSRRPGSDTGANIQKTLEHTESTMV